MRARAAATTGRSLPRDWHPVGVEEYGYVAPDPLDPDIVYGGKVTRYDRRTGQVSRSVRASDAAAVRARRRSDYRTLRTAPLFFSTVDPHALFFASNVLWKTTNGGKTLGGDQPRPDAHRLDVPASVGVYSTSATARARHARRHLHRRPVVRRHQTRSGPAPTTG